MDAISIDGVVAMPGRPPMNQVEFDEKYGSLQPPTVSIPRRVGQKLKKRYVQPVSSCTRLWYTLISFLPIIGWMPRYKWKSNLLYDAIGGITVGIMHIPQGIAYSALAGQTPVVGLYTSFLAPLIYMFFGTSRHCSLGTFAVVALMSGNAVHKVNGTETADGSQYSNSEIAITLTCLIGIIQIVIAAVGFSFVTTYFSDELVGGFTTGASIYVFVTQLKDIFGIKVPKREGMLQIFYNLYDIAANIGHTNLVTLALSSVVLVILVLARYLINPFFQKKLRSPVQIPFDLLMVVLGTVVSMLFHLQADHGVITVGYIPTKLPTPMLPQPKLFGTLLPDAASIAAVVLAIHISLAKEFGKKFQYTVDTTQEFYALGVSSVASSFFPVYPNSCSLSRTLVSVNAGTRTQLSTIFSSALLLSVVLFLAKWLSPLPMCVLASIIIVALFGMFEKIGKLPALWKLSKIDFCIWVIAFLATVITDVTVGLVVAICFALFTTVARAQWGKWHVLVNISGTTDYRDVERYRQVFFFDGICIFRFDSPLMFSNVDRFRAALSRVADDERMSCCTTVDDKKELIEGEVVEFSGPDRCIIVDCSPFVFIDLMGTNTLIEVHREMKEKGIRVLFAATRGSLRDMFARCDPKHTVPKTAFYPTIHDAICLARTMQDTSSTTKSISSTPLSLTSEKTTSTSPV